MKEVLGGNFTALDAYIKNGEIYLQLNGTPKRSSTKKGEIMPKAGRWQKIIKLRVEIKKKQKQHKYTENQ